MQETSINVVFLQSAMRAGALFFASLVDGHPDVAMLPRTFELWRVWPELPKDSRERLVVALVQKCPHWFLGTHNHEWDRYHALGPTRDQTYALDAVQFAKEFLRVHPVEGAMTYSSVFLALHLAYHRVAHQAMYGRVPESPPRMILFNVHGTNMQDFLTFNHPQATKKIVFLTRDPLKNLQSGMKHLLRCEPWSGLCLPEYSGMFREVVVDNREVKEIAKGYDIITIALEVLHRRSEMVMKQFCVFGGIPFAPCLLRSTIMGLEWWGNGQEPINGINREFPLTVISDLSNHNSVSIHGWRAMLPVLGRRLLNRRHPLGVERVSWNLLLLLEPLEYERLLWKKLIVPAWTEVKKHARSLFFRTAMEEGTPREKFRQSVQSIRSLLMQAATFAKGMFERVLFSIRFRNRYPEDCSKGGWAGTLSGRNVASVVSIDSEGRVAFSSDQSPTECLYSEEELGVIREFLERREQEFRSVGALDAAGRVGKYVECFRSIGQVWLDSESSSETDKRGSFSSSISASQSGPSALLG